MRKYENPKFIAEVKAGKSRRQLAKLFSVSTGTVGGWLTMARAAALIPTKMLAEKLITKEERDTILQMLRDGTSVREVSRTTGRSRTAVQALAIASGIKKPYRKTKWRKEQDDVIRQYYPTSMPARKIADMIGVSVNQVIGRARRLGLSSGPVYNWTIPDDERAKIAEMWKTMGPAEIGRWTGRSPRAISNLAKREGWPSRAGNYPAGRKTADRDYAERKNKPKVVRPKATLKLVPQDVIPESAKPMLQHRNGQCRYPYGPRGNVHYCCVPVFKEGGSYCEGHSAICYDYDRMKRAS
jgi:hypothetical protein